INSDAQPGRLFPDAVNFIVEGLGEASVTVRGGVGGVEIGDEVLLINLQGDTENHENVGNYEIKEIARINYGQNTIFFTTNLSRVYGATDSNEDLTGQKIMLQRVPRYRSLRVDGTMTADPWDGTKGGVFFVKVLGDADIRGTVDMEGKGYRHNNQGSGEGYRGLLGAVEETLSGGGGGRTGSPGHHNNQRRAYCGGGGSYGTEGTQNCAEGGSIMFDGRPGVTYGEANLSQWHFGSAGGQAYSTYRPCCWRNDSWSRGGGNGGGQIVLWASGLSIRGEVRSRGRGDVGGSGGMIFLRARSMNVGNDRVDARGNGSGGLGRIRLDFFGLSGTTRPEYHPGFAGDTVMQTDDLSGVGNPIQSVTLNRVLADLRGGSINYQVTNGATDNEQNLIWNDIAAGETFTFPENQPGTALRMRATFRNDNLQPLALIGLSLEWTRGE
ncbi:MAG: hypothetical protein CMH50_02110, partial [Myxococcales bacterium]|nr:hypothetical protein [Myxococcales bacterium]